jgi:hypothetical protein
MGLRGHPLSGVAFEDAAGCPACLSLSLPGGDGDGDEVKKK